MKSVTQRLDADLDVVALGAATGMLWRRNGRVIAGLGTAARIPIDGPFTVETARALQTALAEMAGRDDINLPGSGPLGLLSLPFDTNGSAALVVPESTFVVGPEGRRWVTNTSEEAISVDDTVSRATALLDAPDDQAQPTQVEVRSAVKPETWRDDIVGGVIARIRSGELSKAVLARELRLSFDAPINQRRVISRLADAHPSAIVFALDGFVGASPELLVARTDDVVRAHPLAGTASRGSAPDTDQRMAADLLASTKNQWEHRITIDWLLNELLPFCSYVDAEPEPSIVSLPNVHHLGTRVEGRLSEPPASVLELVAALHPTPAVGGNPQRDAVELIAEVEGADRGRYAGATGWLDGAGNGAFCVAIRSAQLDGANASLFAGVGVVKDSDPSAELEETRSKFQAMLPVLLRL